jgi:hypothetical protein
LDLFNGVTLVTAGNQTVTATDTVTRSITGSATVVVSGLPGPTVVGSVTYVASIDPRLTATQAGAGTLVAGAAQGAEQMSAIRYLQVTFSTAVTLDPSGNYGLKLMEVNGPAFNTGNTNPALGRHIQASVVSAVMNAGGAETVTYSFSGAGTEYGSLEDGNYSLRFNESAIQGGGPGGPALSSSGDPFTTGPALFHRLFGDGNGDGKVDNTPYSPSTPTITDNSTFMAAYRSLIGMANYRAYYDFNNDGRVDSTDYYQFLRRNGKKLNADGSETSI